MTNQHVKLLSCSYRSDVSEPSRGRTVTKKRNWKEHNEPLVRRWSRQPRRMNEEKEGAEYRYPASLMSMLAAIHVYLPPYREVEGFVRVFSEHVEGLRVPDYTTMWWRISTTKVQLDPGVDPDEDVTITIDSNGIKISNRGEWIRQKWMAKSGFVKVHLAVYTKRGKILLMQVTKDVHDRKIFVPLVEEEASSTGSVTRAIGDEAYDSREIFRHLDTN